jgi:hypothetical protein
VPQYCSRVVDRTVSVHSNSQNKANTANPIPYIRYKVLNISLSKKRGDETNIAQSICNTKLKNINVQDVIDRTEQNNINRFPNALMGGTAGSWAG